MQAIFLAAGYATRLYPLTKNQPNSLLKGRNKTILDSILEKLLLFMNYIKFLALKMINSMKILKI